MVEERSSEHGVKFREEDNIVFGFDIETEGLSPHENKLLTIQYQRNDNLYFYPIWEYSNERDLILAFLDDWYKIKRSRRQGGALFVGYNQLKFDASFLMWKARKNDIIQADGWSEEYVWQNLVHGPAFIDMAQLLRDDMYNFPTWRYYFTGEIGEYRSAQIPEFYRRGEYDKIEAYVADELEAFENVWEAIKNSTFYRELLRVREEAESSWNSKDSSSLSDF